MVGNRELGVDAARGVALLSMFIAHFAPAEGPFKVLALPEYLTAFLFVLLIGIGAELGRTSPHRWRSSQVRATALVVTGLLLMQLPTQIAVVLVWLGVLTVLATWLVELPSWLLGAVAVVAVLVEPPLMDWAEDWVVSGATNTYARAVVELCFSGTEHYRVLAFVLPACAGILLARHLRSDVRRGAAAAVSAVVAVVVIGLDELGRIDVVAYTGTRPELVLDTALAVFAATVTWALAPRLGVLAHLLASMGVMSLTIYTAQVVGDWYYTKTTGDSDDRWAVVAVAVLGSVLLALAWRPVARATGWRGPLEGPVDLLTRGRRTARTPVSAS